MAWTVMAGVAAAAVPVQQFPAGALDAGFASGGVLTQAFGSTPDDQNGIDAVLQTDGKIVVLTTAGRSSYLSRYTPDGELDSSFGDHGSVTLPNADTDALTIDENGRIVVIGSEYDRTWHSPPESPEGELSISRGDAVVYRFLPNGELDTSFGTGGKATISAATPEGLTPGSNETIPRAVLVGPGGDIMVGGETGAVCYWHSTFGDGSQPWSEFAEWAEEFGTFVARLSATGAPEAGFGQAGIATTHGRCLGAPAEDFIGLAQISSETVLALSAHLEDETWRFRRYSSTGMIGESATAVDNVLPQQMAAVTNHDVLVETRGALHEYNSEGAPVSSFGEDGSITPSLGCTSNSGCFAVLPDGRIVVAGGMTAPYPKVGVKRYLPDGALDTSFGNKPAPGEAGSADEAWAQLTQSDELRINKLLLAGGQPLVVGAAIVPGSNGSHLQTVLAKFTSDGRPPSEATEPGEEHPSEEDPPPPPSEEPPGETPSPTKTPTTTTGHATSPAPSSSPDALSSSPAFPHTHPVAVGRSSPPRRLHFAVRPVGTISIARLLATGHYRMTATVPAPGEVTIRWTGCTRRSRCSTKTTVAEGVDRARGAGPTMIVVRLTGAGRRLLRMKRSQRIVVTAVYTVARRASESRRIVVTLAQ